MAAAAAAPELPATFVEGFHDPAVVAQMPYRRFGRSGRLVSQLSLGASSFGNVYGTVQAEADCHAVTLAAVKAGINLIDTAPWYGHGLSESVLGRALKAVPRSAYYLSTKVCRYRPGTLEMFDFTYERTIQSVHESLARLQLDYIDVIQIHDPEFAPSLDLVLAEVVPALRQLQLEGKVRYIGITGYPLSALKYLAEHCPAGVEFESCLSYCRYNLHDTGLVDAGTLELLTKLGLGVVNGSPYSMGLLVARGPPAWHPAKAELKARCEAAAKAAAARGLDIAHLALAFCLLQPDIVTTMTSTTSTSRLQDDIDMVTRKAPYMHGEGLAKTQAAIADLRREFFSGPEFEARELAHWEGEEVNKYWRKVGHAAMRGWYVERVTSMGRVPAGLVSDGETLSTVAVGKAPSSQPNTISQALALGAPHLYGGAK
jgi:aryl-alcohol dehydrogenase-like predicted oxidoreductase